ncbi:MAG: acyltransferase [Eubacterium sp.]|nr:acyltransferase [Eubacterium sp.]
MRKTYLDNIKWITVALVVLYHVIYMYNGIEVYGVVGPFHKVQYQDMFQYIVYPWFMLLLFVVSGMCARFYLDNHSHREFIRTRTRKYLVPSTLGVLTFGWVLGYYNMNLSDALGTMGNVPKIIRYLIMAISGTGPLWYIQVLWIFSMILVVFRKVEKDRLYQKCAKTPVGLIVAFVLLIWESAQILNTPIISVYRFGIYGTGFLLGYLVFSHEEVMERLSRCWISLTILGLTCCIGFCVLFWGKPYAEHEVLDTFFCNGYAWFGTIGVLAFMKRWGGFENSFSIFMTKKSWGLYLFHYTSLAMCSYYIKKFVPETPAVICYGLVTIAAFVGGILIYEIVSRIPVIRWLVCGIGGKKDVSKKFIGTEKTA